MLVEIALHVLLAQAVVRNGFGMLRAHHQHITSGQHGLVVPPCSHRSPNRIENTRRRAARVIGQALRRIATIHAQRTLIGRKTPLHMQRLPGIHFLIFPDQKRKLARMPHARLIDLPRAGPAQVDHHQPQCSSNRRIGPPPRTEHTSGGVDLQSLPNRAIDDKQRRGGMRGALHAMQADPLVAHRFHACHHHREILGFASRHHGIHRDLFNRCFAKVGRHQGNHFIRSARGRGQHPLHLLLRRRHHREPIGDPLLKIKLDRINVFGNLIHPVPASVLCHTLPLCKLPAAELSLSVRPVEPGQRPHCRRNIHHSSSANPHPDIAL